MKGIQEFFRKVFRSCYDVEWYREVRTLTVGAGLRYAALLHALLAVIVGALLVPGLLGLRAEVVGFFEKEFPVDAYIAVDEGKFSTNLETPFVRTVGDATFIVDPSVEDKEFPERLKSDKPVIVLGKSAVYVQVDSADRRVMENDVSAKGRVTSAIALDVVRSVSTVVLVLAALAAALAYGLFAFAMNVGFAWLAAFLLVRIGKRYGAPLVFARWFPVTLFAVTLPTIVDGLMLFLGLRTPFVFTGLFALIVYAVFIDEKQNPVPGLAHEAVIVPPAPTEDPVASEKEKEDGKKEE